MELQTASQVSRNYGISTRMLRYYEQAGLIQSLRKDDYAYRVYDESAVNRLRQIIVLRKLRVPVKQIISILNNSDAAEVVEIFRQNISEIDNEITALSTVKSILKRFVEEINEKADVNLKLLGDEAVFDIISSLSFSDNQIKERKENLSMEELNKANEELMKLEDKDVRIVYLPPMTIAAAYASGEGCEGKAGDMIAQFVKESGLLKIKPDARSFGFDCSKGAAVLGEPSHVYEMWVSIPDDIEISAPLVKRTFGGGLYAAHVLRAWDFQDWRRLKEWVDASDKYDNDWGSPRWESPETLFGQGFEETLNFYNFNQTHNSEMSYLQLDLLFPIKEKENGRL
jgi:DNA-binding transcriptional MerR regulator